MSRLVGTIKVERPTEEELKRRGVRSWPVWEKGISTFDWTYDGDEECFFLEGDVTVRASGESIRIGKGDFVRFPRGLSCVWEVNSPVRKHYRFP
jgi:hypothetical protein